MSLSGPVNKPEALKTEQDAQCGPGQGCAREHGISKSFACHRRARSCRSGQEDRSCTEAFRGRVASVEGVLCIPGVPCVIDRRLLRCRGRIGALQWRQALPQGKRSCLHATGQLQFGQDMAHMGVHPKYLHLPYCQRACLGTPPKKTCLWRATLRRTEHSPLDRLCNSVTDPIEFESGAGISRGRRGCRGHPMAGRPNNSGIPVHRQGSEWSARDSRQY